MIKEVKQSVVKARGRYVSLYRSVKRSLGEDRYWKRLRKADRKLSSLEGSYYTNLDNRQFPASVVAMQAPHELRRTVLISLLNTLTTSALRPFVIPSPDGWPSRIGITSEEWLRALAVLEKSEFAYLVGKRRPRAKTGDWVSEAIPISEITSLKRARKIVLFQSAISVDQSGRIIAQYGARMRVTLEHWQIEPDGSWTSPSWNYHGSEIVPSEQSSAVLDTISGSYPSVIALAAGNVGVLTFPIDAVFTWVDGTDTQWIERKRAAIERMSGEKLTESSASDLRFVGHDELRYALRSIEMYAPWIRHIWIVTDDQVPAWLNEEHPRVSIVDHKDIFPDDAVLPTFNSHSIEANLHRIPGLSEKFLYFNDDMFLSRDVMPDLFYQSNGIAHIFYSRAQIQGGPNVSGESASDSAGKNNRALIDEISDKRIVQKLYHAPYALSVTCLEEVEQRWPEWIQYTRESRFRRIGDVTLSGSLQLYYAYVTGRSIPGPIKYRYVDVGRIDADKELDRLYRDRNALQTFCLNESSSDLDPAKSDELVRAFLAKRFPDRSTFEIAARCESELVTDLQRERLAASASQLEISAARLRGVVDEIDTAWEGNNGGEPELEQGQVKSEIDRISHAEQVLRTVQSDMLRDTP